jgi:hypothetical protein
MVATSYMKNIFPSIPNYEYTILSTKAHSVVDGGPWQWAKNPAITTVLWRAIADYGGKTRQIGRYLPYQRGQNPPPIFDNTKGLQKQKENKYIYETILKWYRNNSYQNMNTT